MNPHADLIREWTRRQVITRRSYALEPFAGTRDINKNDQARERMAARRAAKKERPA